MCVVCAYRICTYRATCVWEASESSEGATLWGSLLGSGQFSIDTRAMCGPHQKAPATAGIWKHSGQVGISDTASHGHILLECEKSIGDQIRYRKSARGLSARHLVLEPTEPVSGRLSEMLIGPLTGLGPVLLTAHILCGRHPGLACFDSTSDEAVGSPTV